MQYVTVGYLLVFLMVCISDIVICCNISSNIFQMPQSVNNNNNQDDIYGAVIIAKPLREFTRFI